MAPGDQLLTAVVLVDGSLDQDGAGLVLGSGGEGRLELAGGVGAEAEAVAVGAVEGLHQEGVVPVLDLVVAAVVDLHLDRVAAVVDEQDRDGQVEAHHLRHLLCRDLEGAVTDDTDGPALGVAHGVAERGRDGPADVAPLHLNLVACTPGEVKLGTVEPGVTRLDEEGRVGGDQGLQLALDLLAGEVRVLGGLVDDEGVRSEAVVLDHSRVVVLDLGGEVVEELTQADTAEVGAGEGDMLAVGLHKGDAGHGGPADGGVVVEDTAGADDGIGPVQDGIGSLCGHLTPEDADELRVVLREHALCCGLDGDSAAHGLGELEEGLVGTGAGHLGPDEDHGLELALEVDGGVVGGSGQSGLVRVDGLGDGGDGAGADTGGARQVGGDLDVAGFPGQEGGTDGSVDEPGGLLSTVDGNSTACDLLGHLQLV